MNDTTILSLIDLAKITIPAIITGFVGYFAGKLQIQTKIVELDKANEFNAREKLFQYYKELLDRTSKEQKELGKSLGYLLAITTDDDFKDNFEKANFLKTFINATADSLKIVLNLLKDEGFEKNEEYTKLSKHQVYMSKLTEEFTSENIIKIFEISSYIHHCQGLVFEKFMKNAFSKYIND